MCVTGTNIFLECGGSCLLSLDLGARLGFLSISLLVLRTSSFFVLHDRWLPLHAFAAVLPSRPLHARADLLLEVAAVGEQILIPVKISCKSRVAIELKCGRHVGGKHVGLIDLGAYTLGAVLADMPRRDIAVVVLE